MAESAPLSTAHYHARKAAVELEQVHFSQAAHEHHLASTDFSRAAKGTSDAEALRVLRLLEEQHRKLANIAKTRDEVKPEVTQKILKSSGSPSAGKDSSCTPPPPDKAGAPKPRSNAAALGSTRSGSGIRDSSPSLARDIASRRGIPPSGRAQPSAAAQARARQLSPESGRPLPHGGVPKVPSCIVDSQSDVQQAQKSKKAEDDEGFAKFYSNLTNGTMSRLSSVLAYAGLPLTAEDLQLEQSDSRKPQRRTVSAGDEPNLKKIFSKAALDAIEDQHRSRGLPGHGFGPAESFYVVQKGGGTYSYADIARAQQKQLAGLGEEDDGEFVDAKEAPGPPSPNHSRFSSQQRGSFGSPRTQEELELENTTLKHTLEQLAGRLAAFEAHAQDASMAALTQSMASLRPGPSGVPGDVATSDRLRQLERQVEKDAEDRQKAADYTAKLERHNRKWRAKFDGLTKSARARMLKGEKGPDEAEGDGVAGE